MIVHYRNQLIESDREAIGRIVESTGFFTPEETAVAIELVEENLSKGISSGYFFLIAEDDNANILGYTCFGPIPCTRNSFDLYWIAVNPENQGCGIGHSLLKKTEHVIAEMGGASIYIETSSRKQYSPTRRFYLKSGYCQEAELKDFYACGDNKVIFAKHLLVEVSQPNHDWQQQNGKEASSRE